MLGGMLFLLGVMKTFMPVTLLAQLSWSNRSSTQFIRFVGFSELLIGLGLILPQLLNILPLLTPLAAAFLCVIMILAIREHIKHNETNEIWKNVLIMFLAAFVAVGRFKDVT